MTLYIGIVSKKQKSTPEALKLDSCIVKDSIDDLASCGKCLFHI